MNIQEYIKPELLTLIPVLYLIGLAIKKSKVEDRFIPIILGVCSVALCSLWVIANVEIYTFKEVTTALFTAITQGILIAGASVYVNQLYKQAQKED